MSVIDAIKSDYDNYINTDLDENDFEYSNINLGETIELRELYIKDILRWYEENPNINGHTNHKYILYFLRGAKFNLEKAKKKILSYYQMRTERIEWFENRDPFAPEICELLDIGVFLPLKKRDKENRLVVIIRTAAHDPHKHLQNNVFKIGKMILDYMLHLDETISVYGVSAIFDMASVTFAHALQLPPNLISRAVHSWENYPCRVRSLRFINAPIYINVSLNIFKSFMTTKLKSRISTARDSKLIDLELCDIPTDLGGTGESYADLALYYKNLIQNNAQWFQEDEKYKSVIE